MKPSFVIRWGVVLAVASSSFGCALETGNGDAVVVKAPFEPQPPPEPYIPTPPPPTTRRVRILHTNDEHSHLLGFGPISEYPFLPVFDGNDELDVDAMTTQTVTRLATGFDNQTVGGAVRRQYLINKIRSESTDPVLTLSAGDVMMGTLFHVAVADPTANAAPDQLAMAIMGYDFMTLGNHEFDFGPDILASTLAAANKTTFGGAVPVIASNIHFDDVQDGGPGAALRDMYGEGDSGAPIMPWATKMLPNGLKVGFLGLMGYDAALVSPGKDPVSFSRPSDGATCVDTDSCDAGLSCVRGRCVDLLDAAGHVMAMAGEAQAVVDQLRDEEHVDLVIAMTHLGSTEDEALATATSGIDVIIGGHSHEHITPFTVASAIDGQTIIVQAGSYGTLLGDLVVTVEPDGTVGFDAAASTDHDVDYTLDSEIVADSAAVETALTFTGGVIAPVVAGLNAFTEPLGVAMLDDLVTSNHDVVGEVSYADTNLSHLVTDANMEIIGGGVCRGGDTSPMVVVQANGVLRESLKFGEPTDQNLPGEWVTLDDVFRVLPLGANPFPSVVPALPGFPMVMFRLAATELLAGADVGVTQGFSSDSFFLSYAGMRVTYDRTRSAFEPLDPVNTGVVVKMELGTDLNNYAWVLYDVTRSANDFGARWRASDNTTPINPNTTLVTVVTNLYLAGFLDAFGLSPRDAVGAPTELIETVLCQTATDVADCVNDDPALEYCVETMGVSGFTLPEMKEWQSLLTHLTSPLGLGGVIPDGVYEGLEPSSKRVLPVVP